MTKVNGIGPRVAPPRVVGSSKKSISLARTRKRDKASDAGRISAIAELTAKARKLPDVRRELIRRVKAEIADGTYDTHERMEIAATRLLKELLSED